MAGTLERAPCRVQGPGPARARCGSSGRRRRGDGSCGLCSGGGGERCGRRWGLVGKQRRCAIEQRSWSRAELETLRSTERRERRGQHSAAIGRGLTHHPPPSSHSLPAVGAATTPRAASRGRRGAPPPALPGLSLVITHRPAHPAQPVAARALLRPPAAPGSRARRHGAERALQGGGGPPGRARRQVRAPGHLRGRQGRQEAPDVSAAAARLWAAGRLATRPASPTTPLPLLRDPQPAAQAAAAAHLQKVQHPGV